MVIIAGKVYVERELRDAYVASFAEFVELVRRTSGESGCLDFVISADPIEPERVNIFELWQSKEQLDAFREKAQPPELMTEILREDVTKYEISSSGPPFP